MTDRSGRHGHRLVGVVQRTPIRLRVAAAFALTAALAIVGLGVFVALRVEQTLVNQTRTSLQARTDALLSVSPERRALLVEAMTGETFGQVVSADGVVTATSARLGDQVALPRTRPAVGAGPILFERDVRLAGEDERETVELLATEVDGDTVIVGSSRESVEKALDQVVTQLLVAGPLALLAATLAGYWVAGAALRPMEAMRARAETISDTTGGGRLPLPAAHDEVRRLGTTLNHMLDRLDASLARERRFVSEASHELRTPLALLRLELELATSSARSGDELRAALGSVQEEVARLSDLAEDLLLLDNSSAVRDLASADVVDVADVCTAVVGRFSERAHEAGRVLQLDVPSPAWVRGDRTALDRVVANLVDNALRHGTGRVVVSARQDGRLVRLIVADEGSTHDGSPPASWWVTFSRSPQARSGGHGLGLPIVRSLVEHHGGSVEISASEAGTQVCVLLPDVSEHDRPDPLTRDRGTT